jgi:hypothetical protein
MRQSHTVGFPGKSDRLVAEAATYTTQQTQDTNTHAPSGIRTRDHSNRGATDLRLRSHGYCNRQVSILSDERNLSRHIGSLISKPPSQPIGYVNDGIVAGSKKK